MRTFFDYNEVKAQETSGSSAKLKRTPSISRTSSSSVAAGGGLGGGNSQEKIKNLSESIMMRLKYLLDCNLKDKFDLKTAKKNWKLLAKIATNHATLNKIDSSPSSKFAASVEEAENISKLKSLITFRRKIAQASRNEVPLSEHILKFLQSEITVGEIMHVRKIRKNRTHLRSEALNIYFSILSGNSSPSSMVIGISSLASSFKFLDTFGDISPQRHYLYGLKGCESKNLDMVTKNFEYLFNVCVEILSKAFTNMNNTSLSLNEKLIWGDIVKATIHSLCHDYELIDHSIMAGSNFIEVLKLLLTSSDKEISSLAWSNFEVILSYYDSISFYRHRISINILNFFFKKLPIFHTITKCISFF